VGSQANASDSTSAQSGSAVSGATSSDQDKEKRGNAFGKDEDKKTGLDRADQAAGEHGKQGRDNAREKQGR